MPATIAKPTPWWPGINLEHPQARGLVAAWLFNEGAGSSVRDLTGNGNEGVLTSTSPSTRWVGSDHGFVLDFDGAGDFVSIPKLVSLAQPYTLSLWFKAKGTSAAQRLLSYFNVGDSEGHHLWIQANEIGFTLFDGAFASNSVAFTDTTDWHNLVGVHHGSSVVDCYLDGTLLTGTTDRGASAGEFKIGSGADGGSLFDGLIDDVRIYNNRGLSAANITHMLADPYALYREPDPVELWKTAAAGGIVVLRRRIEAA
ncbi:hypothetical protein LCGC14_0878550 [marine sediment metagenome]|uniref:LamG-like jellyroll fold domain-containing protein n=1 Tax=marine sediment metagenome TaxID=412755 RepID=A0A0F9P7H0_9ZZZZ|nr:LamG domain-containing protein [Phycisphaerae bacterium]